MLAKEIMSRNVLTVGPETSLKEAGMIFKEKRISGLPVVDDKGQVTGVVTITDMMKILGQIYELKESEKNNTGLALSKLYEEEKARQK